MGETLCSYCRKPLRNTEGNACRGCVRDVIDGHPPGSRAAKRSAAAKVRCPHCGAKPGELCTGPSIVRFIHARRRDLAAHRKET